MRHIISIQNRCKIQRSYFIVNIFREIFLYFLKFEHLEKLTNENKNKKLNHFLKKLYLLLKEKLFYVF